MIVNGYVCGSVAIDCRIPVPLGTERECAMKETSFAALSEASRKSESVVHTLHIVRGYGSATLGLWRSQKAPKSQRGWEYAEFCAWTRSQYQRDITACDPKELIGFTLEEISRRGRVRILNSSWFGDLDLTEEGVFSKPTSYQVIPCSWLALRG
jgi:hypothetical protein